MTPKSILFLAGLLLLFSTSSCKFYFNESEYLGTYVGAIDSETGTVLSSEGQLIITDAGDNMVDLELVTAGNPTYYWNELKVERGYSLSSQFLRIDTDQIDVRIDRNNHSISLAHINGSVYDYRFNGNLQ